MTEYTRRAHIIVTSADQAAANLMAEDWDPDTGGSNTFRLRLSSDGSEPATHFGCSSLFTAANLAQVQSDLESELPDSELFRGHCELDHEEGVTRYTFLEAIAELSLQRILPSW